MKHSHFLKANNSSRSQKIPHILWNQKVHHHVHKSPPFLPILRHSSPVYKLISFFFTIRINIILPSVPMSSNLSLSFRFSYQNLMCFSLLPFLCHMLCPSCSQKIQTGFKDSNKHSMHELNNPVPGSSGRNRIHR
jgi:hypothetical protein